MMKLVYKIKIDYRILDVLFVSAVIVLAILLRVWGISSESLRLDETQSIWQATHSTEFIHQYMLKNVHLPLHNSLLHYWIKFFGSDVTTVRMLALIPGILTIPVMYYLSNEIIGSSKSKMTVLIAALSPIWVWYSKEIRMYTLLILITTLSYLFFCRILKKSKFVDYVFYTLVNIVGIYTHYFFLLVLGVQALYTIIMLREMTPENGFANVKPLFRLGWLILCAEILIAVYYPWIKSVFSNYGSGTYAPVLATPQPFNIVLTYYEYVSGFLPDNFSALTIALWPVFILLGFIFLSKRQNPFSSLFLLVILGSILPILVGYTFSILLKPIYLSRYFITVTPMLYILVAWYLTELRGWTRYIIIGIIVCWMSAALYLQQTSPENPALENYAQAINYIEERTTPRDVILLAPAYTIYPFEYYYDGNSKVSTMPIWDKKKGAIPAPTEATLRNDTDSLRTGHKRFFLLLTDNLENTKEVKDFLDMNYTKLDKRQFSKHVWVHVYQAEYR